jgi:hypothetical protein
MEPITDFDSWLKLYMPECHESLSHDLHNAFMVGFEIAGKKQEVNPLTDQKGGDHYAKLGIYQPWIVLSKWLTPEELKGAMKKDVISYLAREADKGGRLDIEKAMHTMQIYLELTEAERRADQEFNASVRCDDPLAVRPTRRDS